MITQNKVRELLDYNRETGVFIWKVSIKGTKGKGKEAGTLTSKGYRDVCVEGKKYGMHRLAFLYELGYVPENVDHINGIKSDNRWNNLRPATTSDNSCNCKGRGTRSGYKNVYYDPRGKAKFFAIIRKNKKSYHTGYFETAEEASKEACRLREYVHGEFANHAV